MRPLLENWPERLRSVVEFQRIAQAEQPEFEALETERWRLLQNQFIETSDVDGIALLERAMGVPPISGGSPEERRFALRLRALDKRPTTLRFLDGQLLSLCGPEGYSLEVIPEEYRIRVRLALSSKRSMAAAVQLIHKLKPANLMLDIDLMYNRHRYYVEKTQAQMGRFTHESLRSDPIS